MRIISFIITLNLILGLYTSKGQWTTQSTMSTYIGNGYYGTFSDAGFMSPEVGFYNYFYYWSPSSGTSYYSKISTDSCKSWGTGGAGQYIYSLPQQKTVYAWSVNNFGYTNVTKIYNQGLSYYNHPSFNSYTMDIHGPDSSNIYALCSGQLKKLNGTFFPVNLAQIIGFNAYRLFFTDTLNGFILGDSLTASMHSVLKTTDGGLTFTNCFTDTSFFMQDFYFINNMTGFIVGRNGRIIKTIDGGLSWQNLNSGFTSHLTSVRFVNSMLGFVGGFGGLMLRTIDGGVTFIQDSINTTNPIKKIVFVNDTIGYAVDGYYVFITNLTSTGIEMLFSKEQNSLTLFPNPNLGTFNIKVGNGINTFKDAWFYVYDYTGKEKAKFRLNKERNKLHFNISNCAKGLYFVKLIQNEKIYTGKIMVE